MKNKLELYLFRPDPLFMQRTYNIWWLAMKSGRKRKLKKTSLIENAVYAKK
jgi:hypothetical protein